MVSDNVKKKSKIRIPSKAAKPDSLGKLAAKLEALARADKFAEIDNIIKYYNNIDNNQYIIGQLKGIFTNLLKQNKDDEIALTILSLINKYMPEQEPTQAEIINALRAENEELKERFKNQIEVLIGKIEDLETYKKKLKEQQMETGKDIKAVLAEVEGFEFLKRIVDLGEPTKALPKEIPLAKKWNARSQEYKGMSPEEKATKYLEENWKGYPIDLNYFNKSNIGGGFYMYLIRNKIEYLLPTAFERKLKDRLEGL